MGSEITLLQIHAPAVAIFPEEDQKLFTEKIRLDLFEEFINMSQKSFTAKEDQPIIVEQE